MDANKRNVAIDVMKGIGIILMVIGHMHYSHSIEKFIYGFHMPLFFWISGYLYKPPTAIKVFIARKAKGLILPYAVFGILYTIIDGVVYGEEAFLTGLGGGTCKVNV